MAQRIQVYLDPSTLMLAWRPVGVKGARWHGGYCGIADICKEADRVFTDGRYAIDYVDRRS